MDIGSIFLILALLVPIVIFIARPMIERRTHSRNPEEQELSSLLAQRDQVVATIQELDDDYNLGKIPPESYPSQRNALLQSGADILRNLDAHQVAPVTTLPIDRLEAAIANHRLMQDGAVTLKRKNGNGGTHIPDDDLEQRIAMRRRIRQGKGGGFCPRCGRPVQAEDRFCPKCGATLS